MPTLELIPSESLSHFVLSATLYNTLHLIRESYTTSTTLAWNNTNPIKGEIIILLKSPPITLIFNSFTQRLIKIDLEFKSLIEQTGSELQSIKAEEIGHFITYKGKSFRRDSEREESVTKMLSRIMGPASKQTSTGVNQTVVIYPGVSFAITSTSSGTILSRVTIKKASTDITEVAMPSELPKGTAGDLKIAYINLNPSSRTVKSVTLNFHHSSPQPVELTINSTTYEDILATLGAPVRNFWKEDDRMEIHSTKKVNSRGSYFTSYPRLGITLLLSIDGAHDILTKILLHSNLPGEVNFGRFERAIYEFKGGIEVVGNNSTFKEVEAVLMVSGEHKETSMSLDRADGQDGICGKTTEIYGYPGIALEVTDSGFIETLFLF